MSLRNYVIAANVAFLEEEEHYQRYILPHVVAAYERNRDRVSAELAAAKRNARVHFRRGAYGRVVCNLQDRYIGRHDWIVEDFRVFLNTSERQLCEDCLVLAASPYRWYTGRWRRYGVCETYTDGCAVSENEARDAARKTAFRREDPYFRILRTTADGDIYPIHERENA